jgi:large subunit ribosomal protein L35
LGKAAVQAGSGPSESRTGKLAGISHAFLLILRPFDQNFQLDDGRTMPRQKTHKGISKRFRVTASGKAKHRKAFRGHILGPKSGKRKRHLRADGVIVGAQAVKIVDALRPGA